MINIVFDHLKLKKVSAGEVIIREGESGEDFFILTQGEVRVFRNTMAGDRIALANLSIGLCFALLLGCVTALIRLIAI